MDQDPFQPGVAVRIISTNQHGTLQSKDDQSAIVRVETGTVVVALDDLETDGDGGFALDGPGGLDVGPTREPPGQST